MLALIIFLICVLSSGLFICTFFKKQLEDTFAITLSGIVFILFIFGTAGCLKAGVFFLFAVFPVLLGLSVIKLVKDKNIKAVLSRFFTPGFFIFLILTVYFTYTLYGKLYSGHDEFSHWGDVVKAMTVYDRFSTDPVMNSFFSTYPPGMSLLLYFMEEINIVILRGGYIEYISIIASSIFTVAFVIPAFRFMKKNIIDLAMAAGIILFIPQFMYFSAYTYLYIDGFIGIAFGGALLQVLVNKEKDVFYDIYIGSAAFILTLAKDAGILFASLLLVAYVTDRICIFDKAKEKKASLLYRLCLCPLSSAVLGKVLWNYCIKRDGAGKVFASKYDISDYISVLTGNINESNAYRKESLDNFIDAILCGDYMADFSGVRVSYVALFVIFSIAMTALIGYEIKLGKVRKCTGIIVIIMSVLSMFIYTWGLHITYMYNFSSYDAVILTSFWRYMNIGYVGIWLAIFILLTEVFYDKGKWKYLSYVAVLVAIAFTSPIKFEWSVINRQFVRDAYEYRKDVDAFAHEINETVSQDASIFYVDQGGKQLDLFIMHTAARPNRIMNSLVTPCDYYASADFLDLLLKNYDYLAIHQIDDTFITMYGELFEAGTELTADSIYRVDKEKRCLVR